MRDYILIIEHEQDIASILQRYLEFEGFATLCTSRIDAARSACNTTLPQLIILDWRQHEPESDRWMAELRSDPTTSALPIILTTNDIPPAQLLTQMQAAHIPLLMKPFSLDQLIVQVNRLIKRERAFGAE